MQTPIKIKNSQQKEEIQDPEIKIEIEEIFQKKEDDLNPTNDQINIELKDQVEDENSSPQPKRRGRAKRNLETQSDEKNSSQFASSITNSRSASDITKLVRLDLNDQIKRQHQYLIGVREVNKSVEKYFKEEHFNRMTKPDDSDSKQITHRRFDYKFFMNCKVIQERQKELQSKMN